MIPMRKIDLKNERGAALLLTMILMILFSLLTVSMFELLNTSTQISGNQRRDLTTVYIADAGVEHAIRHLRGSPDLDEPFPSGAVAFGGGTYEATILALDPGPSPSVYARYKITSTGAMLNIERAIESDVKLVEVGDTESYAIATTSWKLIPPP